MKAASLNKLADELKNLVLQYEVQFGENTGQINTDDNLKKPADIKSSQAIPDAKEHNEKNTSCRSGFSRKSQFGAFKIKSAIKPDVVTVKNPVVAAPLAGISDNTFRIFASAFGSDLNFTEMISSFGVHYNNRATVSLSNITEYERPCGIQIFGCEPEILLEAAQKLEDKADIIDINMGCPVPKVLKAKSGGFLLTDLDRIEKIVKKLAGNVKKPLTIKIRLGWDQSSINAPKVIKIAEENGVGAVTIHGRTVKQGFGGKADYEIIKDIKKTAKVPIIVSGDVDTPLKAVHVLSYTGCDAVMIGRAARGKPWIFYNILAALKCYNNQGFINHFDFEPSIKFKKKFVLLYLKFLIEFEGEEKAVKQFRKYLAWIFKGVANIGRVKKEFFTVNDYADVAKIIDCI